ncbi:MAG: glutamine amidotransferase [Gemmataceae bacterium]|nr:glutamine amidotransferase [Gemmataceae bacterium]
MILFGATSLTIDPAAPWSAPGVGLLALLGVAAVLVLLTLWTYHGVRNVGGRRVALILALRLAALFLTALVLLRPSLAFEEDETAMPSKLLILGDYSASAQTTDAFNGQSRWDNMQRILKSSPVTEALERLAADKVEVAYYLGAGDVRAFSPDIQPNGKTTDIGYWLHELWQRHGREQNLRGLVLLSDGADHGARFSALEKAALYRGSCPIYTFGLGRTTTTPKQNDIELKEIRVAPDPVSVKGKLTVQGFVNAPGFENSIVNVSLWIEERGKAPRQAGSTKREVLKKTQRNEINFECDAPDQAGEIKVTLKIEPLPGEVSILNNEVTTYVSVTKDGVYILWVEGRLPHLEATTAIRWALSKDQRFRVYFAECLQQEKPKAAAEDWRNFDNHAYDVIVIGDISAERFAGGKKSEVFEKLRELVTHGKGLLMMGGHETFGNSDWHHPFAADVASLLPVEINVQGQIEEPVRMVPTPDGKTYVLQLTNSVAGNEKLWKELPPLDGITRLGKVKPTAKTFAAGPADEPILAYHQIGDGRVMALAGDTMWKVWRRSPETLKAYQTFWMQMMLFLAKQENMEGNVKIVLDRRRLKAHPGERLPFTVSVRGKSGVDVPNPQFTVKVTAPDKKTYDVEVQRDVAEFRGLYQMSEAAGEYRIEASVKGKDAQGNDLDLKPGEAHFLGYGEDWETQRTAADHDLLAKIADVSGGRFQLADERKLAQLLEEIHAARQNQPRPRRDLWPDWRRHPGSDSVGDQLGTLWSTAALACFVLFVALVCTEWYLRRRWGLV